jgi:hypothetical protein
MLGNALKEATKAVQSLYDCTCEVSGYEKSKDAITKETKGIITIKHSSIPCRVSKSKASKNTQTDTVNQLAYELKLITSVELDIIQGDTIEVTNKFGIVKKYLAGEGLKYSTHQEVIVSKEGKS